LRLTLGISRRFCCNCVGIEILVAEKSSRGTP
jgi:hypothetical protein